MPGFHANYAAALCLHQSTAQEILHIYYADGDIPVKVNAKIPVTAKLPKTIITTDLFIAEPQLTFEPNEKNLIGVALRLYGTLTFSASGVSDLTATVSIRAKAFCPVSIEDADEGYQFSIIIRHTDITEFTLNLLNGNNPVNTFGFNLQDSSVITLIRQVIFFQQDRTYMFTHPVLTQLKQTGLSVSKVDTKLFDKYMTIGVDLKNLTAGNPDQLTEFNSIVTDRGWYKVFSEYINAGEDEDGKTVYVSGWTNTKNKNAGKHPDMVGVSVNQIVVNKVFETTGRSEIMKKFEAAKAKAILDAINTAKSKGKDVSLPEIAFMSINSINIELKDNYVVINTNVSTKSATTDVHIKMRLVSIDTDGDTAFLSLHRGLDGFRGEIFHVDIDEPGWLVALQVLGFVVGIAIMVVNPFAGLFVVFIVTMMAAAVIPDLLHNLESSAMYKLNTSLGSGQGGIKLILPGTKGPECTITGNDFVVLPAGLNAWFSFKVNKNYNYAIRVDNRTEYSWNVLDKNPIPVTLNLPGGYFHPQDPIVRIRWEVYGDKKKGLLFFKDEPINQVNMQSPLALSIDHNKEEWQGIDWFAIKCRVYRPWGDITDEIYCESAKIEIIDLLYRDKKYVTWQHMAYYLNYSNKLKNPLRHSLGWQSANRKSKIHKTDVDTRCKFVTHFSKRVDKDTLDYTDDLPFDINAIKSHRHEVCDYCFFGGPDKKNLLP